MKRHHHGLVQLQSPTTKPDSTTETSDAPTVAETTQVPDSCERKANEEILNQDNTNSQKEISENKDQKVANAKEARKSEAETSDGLNNDETKLELNKTSNTDEADILPCTEDTLEETVEQVESQPSSNTESNNASESNSNDETSEEIPGVQSALELLNAIASITEHSERGSEEYFSMRNSPNVLKQIARSNSRDSMDRGNIFETIMGDMGTGDTLSPRENTNSIDRKEPSLERARINENPKIPASSNEGVNQNVTPISENKCSVGEDKNAVESKTEEVKTDTDDVSGVSNTKTPAEEEKSSDVSNSKIEKTSPQDEITESYESSVSPNERENEGETKSNDLEETKNEAAISPPVDVHDNENSGKSLDVSEAQTEPVSFESKEQNANVVSAERTTDDIAKGKQLKADLPLRVIKAPTTTNAFEIIEDIKDDDMPIIEVIDPDAKKPRYKCAFCPQTINHSKHHLFKHQRCHIRKCPYNCQTCNYGTNSLPHMREHIMCHDEASRPPLPFATPRVRHRRSLEPARTTRARFTEERRKSESLNCDESENVKNDNRISPDTPSSETVENSPHVDINKDDTNVVEKQVFENDGAVVVKRASGGLRGRPPGRRNSVKGSGRTSPRSPGRCSPRSPGRSPARAPSDGGADSQERAGSDNEADIETTTDSLLESADEVSAHSPTTSPRSRCRSRKISKTVAAELANNTAIEDEEDIGVPAKRVRRRSPAAGMEEQGVELTKDKEHEEVKSNVIDAENVSEVASLDMSHDDEDDDINEDELDDVDQHVDTSSGDVSEDSVVRCQSCPFTVLAEDEKAQLNLKKHEQYHFRKSKYSCKHCTYSSGRLLVIKKHLEVLHADPSGLVIQRPKSTVKFTGKKIKMSFSFIKKNAFFKPLGVPNRKNLVVDSDIKQNNLDGGSHVPQTRSGGKRVSPRTNSVEGKSTHYSLRASTNDEDKIDVGEETNENADLDSTLSPASKRIRIEDTKQEPLVVYGNQGEKIGLRCHHCPFELPWNHGVTSRMHAHEACHFRTSQFECSFCGWNCGNIIAAKKHMVIHPNAKPADLLKRWGKQFTAVKGKDGISGILRKAGHMSGRRNLAASNMEIIKNLTQKARIIKANTMKNCGKLGNKTVGAILQRKRDEGAETKPGGKTIKEILNMKPEMIQPNPFGSKTVVSLQSPTNDVAGSAKTVRALLDQSRIGMPNRPHVTTRVAPVTVPRSNGIHIQCQYCPFKIRRDNFESAKEMGQHVSCHFQASRFTCNKCKFSVGDQSVFQSHLELCTDSESQVQISTAKFPDSDKPDVVTCQYCPYSVRGAGCQATIKNHEKCHFRRGSFSCKTCNYATNVKENWNRHVKCHRWTEEEGANNLVQSGGKQTPPSPRPSLSKPADDRIDTVKCPHCPFEIPVHYRASSLNMERHVQCHTANDKFRCNHDGCSFSVGEEQVLEKHQRYHEPWFLKTLPQHWKLNMIKLQVKPNEVKNLKLEEFEVSRSNPSDHIDVSKFRNPNGTINVELYMKSAPILYIRHSDNVHAVRCHFCPFQIPLNRNATYGLYENQIRKHEICHFGVGKKKKSCNLCTFRTRSFDSFKAHLRVHSPDYESKMSVGVLLHKRPTRNEIAQGKFMNGGILNGKGDNTMEKMSETEAAELELTKAANNLPSEPQQGHTWCEHCPFGVVPSTMQSVYMAEHEKHHFDTTATYKCPKCKYGTKIHKLFLAHIALHPELQIVDSDNALMTPKRKHMTKVRRPSHRCHTCEFTTANGNLMYRHVSRHGENEQKYSTTVVGSGDTALVYCGGCSYVTSVSGEMKLHLNDCTGKAQLFKDSSNPNGQDEQSTDGEFSDDPGMHSPNGKSGLVDESLVWQCQYCDYKTFREYQLQCHVYHHSPSAKGKFRCGKCGYRAKRDKDYDVHLNFHHIAGIVSPVSQRQAGSSFGAQAHLEVASTPEVTPSPVKEQATVPVFTPSKSPRRIAQRSLSSSFHGSSFDCEICDFSHTSEFHYMKHMIGHTDNSPNRRYRCSICGYGALKTIRLQQHMQMHHKSTGTVLTTEIETRPLNPKYPYLNRGQSSEMKRGGNVEGATLQHETHSSYVKVSNTNQHVLVVGNCTRYRCSKCDFVTDKKRMFKTHWYGHTCSKAARPEECPTCKYRTDTRYRLEFHMKKHHKVPGKARDESKQLAELQALVPPPKYQRNGRVSPRSSRPGSPFRAKVRPVGLPSPTWRKEPLFYCDKCPFYDTSKEVLEQHQEGHEFVQEFRCLYCTYSTKTKDYLKLHITTHFTVTHQQAALDQLDKELEKIKLNGTNPVISQNGNVDATQDKDSNNEKPTKNGIGNGEIEDKICPYCDISIKSDVYSNHVARHTQGSMYLSVGVH